MPSEPSGIAKISKAYRRTLLLIGLLCLGAPLAIDGANARQWISAPWWVLAGGTCLVIPGYYALLSAVLACGVRDYSKKQKTLPGFAQALINVGLVVLIALFGFLMILSHLKHYGIQE